jgi:hypothetical protein
VDWHWCRLRTVVEQPADFDYNVCVNALWQFAHGFSSLPTSCACQRAESRKICIWLKSAPVGLLWPGVRACGEKAKRAGVAWGNEFAGFALANHTLCANVTKGE